MQRKDDVGTIAFNEDTNEYEVQIMAGAPKLVGAVKTFGKDNEISQRTFSWGSPCSPCGLYHVKLKIKRQWQKKNKFRSILSVAFVFVSLFSKRLSYECADNTHIIPSSSHYTMALHMEERPKT